MVMSIEERKAAAFKLFQDIETLMGNLVGRWADEKEYEDINDYKKVLDPHVEKIGGKILKMTKSPFGFQYELEGAIYKVTISLRGQYGYERIK